LSRAAALTVLDFLNDLAVAPVAAAH
jgi:hypothetical protein